VNGGIERLESNGEGRKVAAKAAHLALSLHLSLWSGEGRMVSVTPWRGEVGPFLPNSTQLNSTQHISPPPDYNEGHTLRFD
jgi:hypothetical protein